MTVILFLWIFCTVRLFPPILFLFLKFIFMVSLFFSFCLICIYLYIHNLIVCLDASRWADWDSESEIWLHQWWGQRSATETVSCSSVIKHSGLGLMFSVQVYRNLWIPLCFHSVLCLSEPMWALTLWHILWRWRHKKLNWEQDVFQNLWWSHDVYELLELLDAPNF